MKEHWHLAQPMSGVFSRLWFRQQNRELWQRVILGIGRAIGETMAVMVVVGNQARIPDSIFKGVRTLTTNIVIEMGYATDLHREALIATGVVLFVFILIINLVFSIVKGKADKE